MEKDCFFQLSTKIFYGVGASKKIHQILSENNYKKAVLFVDEGVKKYSDYFNEISKIIENNVASLNIKTLRGNEEPSYDYVDKIAFIVRKIKKPDVIIGIGGGSCLDVTKIIAILLTNSGKSLDYKGFDKVKNPGVPVIAIPTTAGTGSEVTTNASVIDKDKMVKMGVNGKYINAEYAILDAEWLLSLPFRAAVSAGMDALLHAIESYSCKKANPLTKLFGKEAFRLVYNALPAIIKDPSNKKKMQDMLLGSYLAGISLSNSGSSVAHAFSYPLGVYYKAPHGIAGAIVLPSIVEFNVKNGYMGYSELFDEIEYHPDWSIEKKSNEFVNRLKGLYRTLNVPVTFEQWGITKDNVESLSKLLKPFQVAFDQNPIPFSALEDGIKILINHVK